MDQYVLSIIWAEYNLWENYVLQAFETRWALEIKYEDWTYS